VASLSFQLAIPSFNFPKSTRRAPQEHPKRSKVTSKRPQEHPKKPQAHHRGGTEKGKRKEKERERKGKGTLNPPYHLVGRRTEKGKGKGKESETERNPKPTL
jgi:hypothetical protein